MLTLAQLIRHCIVPMYHWTNKLLWLANISIILTHCCLLTPLCDVKNLSQHWFMWWHVAWQHHSFTWMSVGVPFPFLAYTLQGNIFFKKLSITISKLWLKFTHLKSQPHLLGDNELNHLYITNMWQHPNFLTNITTAYVILFFVNMCFFCSIVSYYCCMLGSRISFQLPLMCYVAYSKPV